MKCETSYEVQINAKLLDVLRLAGIDNSEITRYEGDDKDVLCCGEG